MRFLIAAAATTLLAASAVHAADLDLGPLRGTGYGYGADLGPVADWSGVYVGGFGGYGQSNIMSNSSAQALLHTHTLLRDTFVENEHSVSKMIAVPNKSSSSAGYGGFIGYNFTMDEIVMGIEADYTRSSFSQSGKDSIGRIVTTSNGYANDVALAAQTSTKIQDFGTARVRIGYTIGRLLPFATAGVALAQLDTSTTVSAAVGGYNKGALDASIANFTEKGYPLPVPYYGYSSFNNLSGARTLDNPISTSKEKSTVAVGFAAGGGLEYLLTDNIFVRGEYMYAFFNDFDGHKFNLNVVRGGAGVKF